MCGNRYPVMHWWGVICFSLFMEKCGIICQNRTCAYPLKQLFLFQEFPTGMLINWYKNAQCSIVGNTRKLEVRSINKGLLKLWGSHSVEDQKGMMKNIAKFLRTVLGR